MTRWRSTSTTQKARAGDEELADHFRDIQEKYREIAQETKELLREKLVSGDEDEEEVEEEDK
ncbi:MAG TPA: hypothetical protein VGK77_24405 [Candidatus Binatia bacterium]